jgi:esterase/lipase superfamily enzyme
MVRLNLRLVRFISRSEVKISTHRLKKTKSAGSEERRTHLTLVGHSLGGWIVARALSKVASDGINPKKVRVAWGDYSRMKMAFNKVVAQLVLSSAKHSAEH